MNAWCITFLLLVSNAVDVRSDPLDHWQLAAHAAPRFMWSVAEHNGLFVAVGVPGGRLGPGYEVRPQPGQIILSSTNGVDWPTNYLSSTGGLSSVVYGLQGWVAVGDAGAVLTSLDALTWTASRVPTTSNFRALAYGNGIYVAAAGSSIWSSTNAVEWLTGPTNMPVGQIVFGDGVFVGVGSSLFLSTNGLDWVVTTNLTVASLAHSQAGFFAARPGQILQSQDGAVWTEVDTTHTVTLAGSANGVLVGFITNWYQQVINTSTDGVTWVPRLTLSLFQEISAVVDNGSLAVGIGRGMVVSEDGENWRNESTGTAVGYLSGVGAAFGKLFCVGSDGDFGRMLISSDGGNRWIDDDPPASFFGMYSLASANGKLVGVGGAGGLYSSTNGRDWSLDSLYQVERSFYSVTFGRTNFVAVGDVAPNALGSGPMIYVSSDGKTWTSKSVLDDYRLKSVVFGQNGFVAVGGSIFRSSFGTSWTRIIPGAAVEEVAFGRGAYVAVNRVSVWISTNSLNWTQVANTNSLQSISFGGGVFVAVNDSGRIHTSTNGLNWMPRTAVLPIRKAQYVNGLFLGLGSGFDATVYRSDPLWQLGLRRNGGGLTLSVTGVPQTSIRLQSSSQLGPLSVWSDAGKFTFVSDQLTIPLSASQAQTFYRTVPTD